MQKPVMPNRDDFEFNYQYQMAIQKWSNALLKYYRTNDADVLSSEEQVLEAHVDNIKRLTTLEAIGYLRSILIYQK